MKSIQISVRTCSIHLPFGLRDIIESNTFSPTVLTVKQISKMTTAENMSLPLHEDTSSVGAIPTILKHILPIYKCYIMIRSKFLLR